MANPNRLVVLAVSLAISSGLAWAQKVSEVKAFYREGQTFVTFKEVAELKGESYAVYRADSAISAENLAKAEKLGQVAKDSGSYDREKNIRAVDNKLAADKAKESGGAAPAKPDKKAPWTGYLSRYVINDNPSADPKAMLPEGTGLFVWTIKKPGKSFYAVVPVIDGKEAPDKLGAGDSAVEEKVQLPGAVLVWKNKEGTGAVYTHWMDGQTWDPAFEGNAYNFGLATPEKYDGKAALPVMFYGHGMGESYGVLDKASYWPCLWVKPCDKSGSWFFGMLNRDKAKVVNYVEQRVRWMAAWLTAERPNQFWKADPRHFQAHGHSMGGTFCNALAMRMGDIFTSTVSSAGATIHRRNKTWVGGAQKFWGPVDKNLPAVGRLYQYAPEGLKTEEVALGGAWDYQDYAKWALDHPAVETAYLLLNNGNQDGSVVFEPVPDFLDALQKSHRPFAATWNPRGHSNAFYNTPNEGMGAFKLALDESLPAFANASNNDDPRKDKSGQINGKLEWCSAGNMFKGAAKELALVDTPASWAVHIRAIVGKPKAGAEAPAAGPVTVDVTPRRCQQFKAAAGKTYAWENLDYSDPASPKKIASGTVTADKNGLVTVEKFQVGSAGMGNRLVITAK